MEQYQDFQIEQIFLKKEEAFNNKTDNQYLLQHDIKVNDKIPKQYVLVPSEEVIPKLIEKDLNLYDQFDGKSGQLIIELDIPLEPIEQNRDMESLFQLKSKELGLLVVEIKKLLKIKSIAHILKEYYIIQELKRNFPQNHLVQQVDSLIYTQDRPLRLYNQSNLKDKLNLPQYKYYTYCYSLNNLNQAEFVEINNDLLKSLLVQKKQIGQTNP